MSGTINILGPGEFWGNEGDVVRIDKILNAYQSTSMGLSREQLQEIVDQAAEKYGIRAAGECFTIEDRDGDIWIWDENTQTFRWRDTETYPEGFEEGVADIANDPGIKED